MDYVNVSSVNNTLTIELNCENIYLKLIFYGKNYSKFNISHILSIKTLNIQSQNYLILNNSCIVGQNITKPPQCISRVFQQYQEHGLMVGEILM
jgi:hypothetical protein